MRRRVLSSLLVLALLLAAALAAVTGAIVARRSLEERDEARKRQGGGVEAALRWLARHQGPDGAWSATGAVGTCRHCRQGGRDESNVTLTAEASLAFLGAGYTAQARASYVDRVTGKQTRFGEAVRLGLKFLIQHQRPDGSFGDANEDALASFALCEAFGITNAVAYRAPAQRAIAHLESTPLASRPDLVTIGWAIEAFQSAKLSGLDVSPESYSEALAKVRAIGSSDARWSGEPTWAAVTIVSQIIVEKKVDPGSFTMLDERPTWDRAKNDYDHWHWTTNALACIKGRRRWWAWNDALAPLLIEHQKDALDGCAEGSWDPDGAERSEAPRASGRIHATAINALTLQVYDRHVAFFGLGR